MPSKTKHEIDKLRGEAEDTGEVFTLSMKDLQTEIDNSREDIKILDSDLTSYKSRIHANKTMGAHALSTAKTATGRLNKNKYIWLSNPYESTGDIGGEGILLDKTVDEHVSYSFIIPNDFVSIADICMFYRAIVAGGDIAVDYTLSYRGISEAWDHHEDSHNSHMIAASDTNVHRDSSAGLGGLLAVNDTGTIKLNRDADYMFDDNNGDLLVIGILIEYRTTT